MPKHNTYEQDENISDNDIVLGSDAEDNLKTKNFSIGKLKEHFILSIEGEGLQGPQGPIGPMGPQGVAGPVGPAGLNWQGQWVSGTSYIIDDAVGYNGASWFCVNPTSGTISPNLDPTNWALLAAQGSPGPQGPSGTESYKSYVAILGPGVLSTDPPNVNSLVFNNTGGTISFTRLGTGDYAANITGATFTSGKTVCFLTPMYFGANDNITKIGRISNSQVRIKTLTNNTFPTDGVIDCQIEIKIYN